MVVEIEVPSKSRPDCGDRIISMKVNFFVLHRPPEPLHEHVIAPATLAIHADCNALVLERLRERIAGELVNLLP